MINQAIRSLDKELGTNIASIIGSHDAIVYIDDFDQALLLDERNRDGLVEFIKKFENINLKVVLSFSDHAIDNLEVYEPIYRNFSYELAYLVPMNYKSLVEDQKNLEISNNILARLVKNWCINNSQDSEYENLQDFISKYKLNDLIDTPLFFEIIMEVFKVHKDLHDGHISKNLIYSIYFKRYIANKVGILSKEQNLFLNTYFNNEKDLITNCENLAKYLAASLNVKGSNILGPSDNFFLKKHSSAIKSIRCQPIWHLLNIIPLKIFVKENNKYYSSLEDISLSFINESLKNYLIMQYILEELKISDNSFLLSSRDITHNYELVTFFREKLLNDDNDSLFANSLRAIIENSKKDFSPESVTAAANAITILVAAQYSFANQNLENIRIRNANIENGIFHGAKLNSADLSYVNMQNANIVDAELKGTIMNDVELTNNFDVVREDSPILSVAYSKDGTNIAFSNDKNGIKLYNLEKKTIDRIGHKSEGINKIAFSSNKRYIMASSKDNTLKIWDLANSNLIHDFKIANQCIFDACYLAADEYVAAVGIHNGPGSYIEVWRLVDGLKLRAFFSGKPINALINTITSANNNEKKFAVGFSNGVVQIHYYSEPEDNTRLVMLHGKGVFLHFEQATLRRSGVEVNGISFSKDNSRIAVCYQDKVAGIWHIDSKQLIAQMDAHGDYITDISYSPDGNYIATSSFDRKIKIWESENGTFLHDLIGHQNIVQRLAYSPNGKNIASGSNDGSLKVWDLEMLSNPLQKLSGDDGEVLSLAFSKEGKLLATGDSTGHIMVWDTKNYTLLTSELAHENAINKLLFISIDNNECIASLSHDKALKLWNFTNNCLTEDSLLMQSNGNKLYNCIVLNLGDFREGYPSFRLPLNKGDTVPNVLNSFSDLGFLVFNSSKDSLMFWDTMKKKSVVEVCKNSGIITSLSYSLKKKNYAVGFDSGEIKIYSAQDRELLKEIKAHTSRVSAIQYNIDGSVFISGSYDWTIKVWDANSLEEKKCFSEHKEAIECIDISVDNRTVASASRDKTVKIFDYRKEVVLQNFDWYEACIDGVLFSPDGHHLVTGSKDGLIRVYSLESNNKFYLKKEMAKFLTQFVANNATFDRVINLSSYNSKIIQNKSARIINESISTMNNDKVDYEKEMNLYREDLLRKLFGIFVIKKKEPNDASCLNILCTII